MTKIASKIVAEFAPIILKEIQKAQNILLHCHPSPDPDSVGSSLAMKLALEQLNKKVTLIQGDSEIPKSFQFPGVDTITQKSYGEINIDDFDLFIILDSGSIGMVSAKTEIIFPEKLSTIVIDHHKSNTKYAKINLVDPSYPATAQLLFDLFKEMGIKLDHDIALNLFMGIYTDTGGFRYNSVSPDTFRIASELIELAPDYTKTIFIMENSNTIEDIRFEGIALSSVKTYLNNKLVIAAVSNEELKKNGIGEDAIFTGSIANKLKSVIGLEISATIIEHESNLIKISFRTRDQELYDVSRIASALGGGGHKGAAGAKLNMTLQEAIEKVVKTAGELYNL